MTLTTIQKRVMEVLSSRRSEASYLAGGSVLNRDGPRISEDIDIFHGRTEEISAVSEADIAALRSEGIDIDVTLNEREIVEVTAGASGASTQIQWMGETEERFFPVIKDVEMGFRLHDADIAINKVICAALRRQPRDAVDLVYIAETYCPLGPLVWAAAAKLSFGPVRIITEIRRLQFGYNDAELRTVRSAENVDPRRTIDRLGQALGAAEVYCVDTAPESPVEVLFVNADDRPIEATDAMLARGEAIIRLCTERGVEPKIPPRLRTNE